MQVKQANVERLILWGSRRKRKQFTLDAKARDVSMYIKAFKEKKKLLVEKERQK